MLKIETGKKKPIVIDEKEYMLNIPSFLDNAEFEIKVSELTEAKKVSEVKDVLVTRLKNMGLPVTIIQKLTIDNMTDIGNYISGIEKK